MSVELENRVMPLTFGKEIRQKRKGEQQEDKFTEDELLGTRTIELSGKDVAKKRQEIRQYFHATFTVYEKLFEVLREDDTFYQQPEKLRHPLVFYFGHTATFFINKLKLGRILKDRIDPKIESTCAVGVDEMSWDDLNTGHYDWPSVKRLREYRNEVRRTVDQLMQSLPLELPITWESPWWPILMGIEHERIHLETSSVLFRQLPLEHVRKHPLWKICPEARTSIEAVPKNGLLSVPGGQIDSGRRFDDNMYGWDVDYGYLKATVKPFKASKYLVSNAEYYEFMKAGGYERKEFWGEEGWNFIQYHKTYRPVFWVPLEGKDGITYRYRSMTEEHEMPWDWPVDVNFLEAKAFCNWKRKVTGKKIRLPTEEEWIHFRDLYFPQQPQGDQPYWKKAPGNINLEYWCSACPIDRFEFQGGFFDVIGNVWQHTETPVYAFKGFKVHPLYDDFAIPTFDTKHNQIKGGSFIATGNEATRNARYAFRRHFYQHAGFRYVEGEDVEIQQQASMFEKEPDVVDQLEFQYGPRDHGLPVADYHQTLAEICMDATRKNHDIVSIEEESKAKIRDEQKSQNKKVPKKRKSGKKSKNNGGGKKWVKKDDGEIVVEGKQGEAGGGQQLRALDLGCGTGRISFELTRLFDEVIGLDLTTRNIRAALQLQGVKGSESTGTIKYIIPSEGDIEAFREVRLADLKLGMNKDKVEFQQQDACNLDGKKFGGFDLVLASSLLTELYDPKAFLSRIHEHIKVGGLLVLSSDYHWDCKKTPKESWLGGYRNEKTADVVHSHAALEDLLTGPSAHFESFQSSKDLPYIHRRSKRNFDYNITHVTVWRRIK